MSVIHRLLLLAWCLAVPVGCGGGVGYVVRPVRLDQRLQETIVWADRGWVSDKVALIDVDGLLINQDGGSLWRAGENPVPLFAEKLAAAAGDARVKAVVLRVNSPGGTVSATEIMASHLARFRAETGKPVICCITDLGASGGYYLACGARKILCQSSSITGSIGVITQTVSFTGTMKMLGIKAEAIASGPLKAMGSPLKDLTATEREVFQDMVDEFFDAFVAAVAAGRPRLSAGDVRKLADGRVYTGKQAVALGLADRLGNVHDAVDEAKAAAGARRVKVVMYHRPLGYKANVYSVAPAGAPTAQFNLINLNAGDLALLRRPVFLYLWTTDLTGTRGR